MTPTCHSQNSSVTTTTADYEEISKEGDVIQDTEPEETTNYQQSEQEKDRESEEESDGERWNRIKEQVQKMKLLLEKYPKFAKRAGSGQIILQIDAMFNALTNCDNPTPIDVATVDKQLEEFKGTLVKAFDEDVTKWKKQAQFSTHKIMHKVSIILLFVAGTLLCWFIFEWFLDVFVYSK